MIVLFIDAFGDSADSNARFVQLKTIVNNVLQIAGSARQGVQLDIRKFDQLTEYLHNDASTKLDRGVLTSFDRVDCIICDGDISSIRPWHARAQPLYRLMKQCIICDKPCLCAGWTASVLYAAMNARGLPLKFLPNFPEGGAPDDIKSLKAPPKDEVFYEYRSGSIYEYNARKQQWHKAFCLGVCRRKRGDLVVGRTYDPGPIHHSIYRPPGPKGDDTAAKVIPASFAHPIIAGIGVTEKLVVPVVSPWALAAVTDLRILDLPVCPLIQSETSLELFAYGNAVGARFSFYKDKRYPHTRIILTNFVRGIAVRCIRGEDTHYKSMTGHLLSSSECPLHVTPSLIDIKPGKNSLVVEDRRWSLPAAAVSDNASIVRSIAATNNAQSFKRSKLLGVSDEPKGPLGALFGHLGVSLLYPKVQQPPLKTQFGLSKLRDDTDQDASGGVNRSSSTRSVDEINRLLSGTPVAGAVRSSSSMSSSSFNASASSRPHTAAGDVLASSSSNPRGSSGRATPAGARVSSAGNVSRNALEGASIAWTFDVHSLNNTPVPRLRPTSRCGANEVAVFPDNQVGILRDLPPRPPSSMNGMFKTGYLS